MRARTARQRLNHSADYYALLGWTILLTNLPAQSLPPEQMLTLYSLRWRIENIFRAWKSNLHPEMTSRHRTNQHHLRCLLHAQQILLLLAAHDGLLAAPSGPPRQSHTRQRPPVSLFKHLDLLLLASGLLPARVNPAKHSAAKLQRNLLYHSHYECRKRVPLPRIIARLLS